MKKTQFKDAIRNIQKRFVSFLSVCLVIAFGFGLLFTTRYMAAGLEKEYSGYFRERNFKDFEMISSLGVNDNSLKKIRQVAGVTDAEGVMKADGSISFGGKHRKAVVSSVTETISVPEITEGRLPQGRSECILGEDTAEVEGLKVGDRIDISLSGMEALGDGSPLYEKTFTITGLMHDPEQFSRKSVNTVRLPLEAFNEEVTKGLYTEAYVKIEEPAKVSMLSDKYFEETAPVKKALEDISIELGEDRTREMKDEAYATIDEEWAKAEAELADGQRQIDEGEAELNSKLAEGRDALNKAQKTLDSTVAKYEKKIKEGEKLLAEGKKQLDEYDKLYKEVVAATKIIDANLPAKEAELQELKARYQNEIASRADEINELKNLLNLIKELGLDDSKLEEYAKAIKKIANWVLEPSHTELLRKVESFLTSVRDFFRNPVVIDIANAIKTATQGRIDITGFVSEMGNMYIPSVDRILELANILKDIDPEQLANFTNEINELINLLDQLTSAAENAIAQIDQLENEINFYKANKDKYLAEAKEKLDEAHKLYNEKAAELAAGKKKLAAEKKKYQNQIKAGWAKYYAEKAKYEAKLEEAKALLAENRELAEQKLAEARAEVEKMEPCRWITLDRSANSGYVVARSNISATTNSGNIFGVLFMIVTAIVCFSTIVIIIDEQKTLVGTCKAFGFFRKEILGKYLIFGFCAAIVGNIMAILLGLTLSEVVQKKLGNAGLCQVGAAPTIFTPGITLFAAVIITLITVAASFIACRDILRSPASMLMNGAVLKKNKKNKKQEQKSAKKGMLYSRLIMRNMADDKARVAVTIAIIAFSCMLIGMGMSMKLAFDGMVDKQTGVVNKYDFSVSLGADVSEEEAEKLVDVLESEDVAYLPVTVRSMMYKWNGKISGLQLICADPSKIDDFYGVTHPKTEKTLDLPDDGILIQKRMHESYGMSAGDMLPLFDSTLNVKEAEIKGYFNNYYGRSAVASPAAYKAIFGEENTVNCYYVNLNGADADELRSRLLEVTDDISFTEKSSIRNQLKSSSKLYNIMVVVITGMAILISFMILTNLSNIFFNRRKKELSVMRVNGFSISRAKGYLRKETVFTTVAGLILGTLLGALVTPIVLNTLQAADLQLVNSFHLKAWVFAVAIETVFAVIINALVFRKVATLDLKDIAS